MRKISLLFILCGTCILNNTVYALVPKPPLPNGFSTDSSQCVQNGGQLLVGSIQDSPWYKAASSSVQGVALSHTHFVVQPLGDINTNDSYEVVVDNVFASGYDNAEPNSQIPEPLSGLAVGTVIEACGLTYTQNPGDMGATQGIHFVHINDLPTVSGVSDNGWLKIVNSDNTLSPNLEGNTEYLYLWNS